MSHDYEFTLPWPPSVNAWKNPFRNRMILTKRGRDYRKLVLSEAERLGLAGELIEGELTVKLVLNPPTLRRYDVDNFSKSLFDALTCAKFWVDDEQVIEMNVKKGVKTKGGNVEVKINRTRV